MFSVPPPAAAAAAAATVGTAATTVGATAATALAAGLAAAATVGAAVAAALTTVAAAGTWVMGTMGAGAHAATRRATLATMAARLDIHLMGIDPPLVGASYRADRFDQRLRACVLWRPLPQPRGRYMTNPTSR